MAKLIMWNLVTLDGFFEGPGHDISWHHDAWSDDLEKLSIEQGNNAGGLLFGRVTYELMANYWPKESGAVADFMNALPKHVFSRTQTHSDWNNTQMLSGDAPKIVQRLKHESAKDIYLFGSANLASGLMDHGLIDEYRIGIAPVVLGSGTPLFKHSPQRQKKLLSLIDARSVARGVVILRYEPVR